METLVIFVLVTITLFAIAGILLYFTRKTPIKKIDINQTLQGKYEFSEELALPEVTKAAEYIPDPPDRYHDSRMKAMVRDPYWVHLYWEISDADKEKLLQEHDDWQEGSPLLIAYNLTNGQKELFRTPLDEFTKDWYLKVPENTHLVFELIKSFPSGKRVTVLRSNAVVTPRAFMSDAVDEEWLLVDENQKKLYRRIGVGNGPSSPDFYNPQRH